MRNAFRSTRRVYALRRLPRTRRTTGVLNTSSSLFSLAFSLLVCRRESLAALEGLAFDRDRVTRGSWYSIDLAAWEAFLVWRRMTHRRKVHRVSEHSSASSVPIV